MQSSDVSMHFFLVALRILAVLFSLELQPASSQEALSTAFWRAVRVLHLAQGTTVLAQVSRSVLVIVAKLFVLMSLFYMQPLSLI